MTYSYCRNTKKGAGGRTPWQCRRDLTNAVMASLSLQSPGRELPERLFTAKVFDAFNELKGKFPEWLGCLYFEKGPNDVVSRELEEVLFSLGAFRLVTVENYDYRWLRIDPDGKREIKKDLESRFCGKKLKRLTALSDQFAGLVK